MIFWRKLTRLLGAIFLLNLSLKLDLHELMARASCVKRFCKIPDTFDVKTFIESVIKKEKSKDRNATANVVTIANALSG